MPPSMFSDSQWQIMMFWYAALTGVCGGLLLINVVKSGYKYSRSAFNPGIRASFIEDIQRMVLAMGLIALAPALVTLLIGINDGFVWLCGNGLNHFVDNPEIEQSISLSPASMFESVIATVFKTFNYLFNTALGLESLDKLVFNGNTRVFSNIFVSVNTGNAFADHMLNFFMVIFNIYFNAVYTIRFWMITASVVAIPILTWIWVLSGERAVLELFAGEIVQAVFMQSSHALSLGIFMSIAGGAGAAGLTGNIGSGWVSGQLAYIGIFFAGLAGSICVAALVVMGMRLILTTGEKEREEAKEGVRKALIGLLIVGLCTAIASVVAVTLSGGWGVR